MFRRSGFPSIEHPYSERSGEDYITRRTRMPVVESAVYDYPNAHLIIKEERVIREEQGGMYDSWSNYNFPSGNHRSYRAPEAHKKVHFLERDIISELGRNGKYEVIEEKVVNNDGSFIQRENKSNRNKYNFPAPEDNSNRNKYDFPAPEDKSNRNKYDFPGPEDKSNRNKYDFPAPEDKSNRNKYDFPAPENKSNRNKYDFPAPEDKSNRNKYYFPAPEAQKKAHFVEHDKITEVGRNGKHKVTEEKVDNEADSFIKRKHKNFELAKMDTFKVY